jgi:PAS domain S-box-containing protein
MLERTVWATVLLTSVAAFLAWWALKRQLAPLEVTIQVLSDLSKQDTHPQALNVDTQDEIGDLLTAFNRLLASLGDRDTALRLSEERFRAFFEKNTSVQLLIDPLSGAIEDANQAAEWYYGYTKAKLVGMLISEINLLSPARIAEVRLLAAQELRNHFQFQHRLSSGEVRDVEVHSTPIEHHSRTLLLSIVHDVTDREVALLKLRKMMDEQRAILASNIAGIVKLKDRRFEWMNHNFAQMLGYGDTELNGQSTRIVYTDDKTYEEFRIEAYPAIESGKTFRKEMQ